MEVIHPGRANLSRTQLQEELSKRHKVSDNQCIFLKGFRTQYGGGKTIGFAAIYDNIDAAKKYEPKFMLIRNGLGEKEEKSRATWKWRRAKGRREM